MNVADLKTPAALVDLDAVSRNTSRMAERMSALGVNLRPHVKTHKCAEAARLQVKGHSGGITVSTLAEARFFRDAGFGDITYAVAAPLDRLDEIAALSAELERFNLVLDHEATLSALAASARATGAEYRVFLEVDCGDHRAGVDPEGEEGLRLARLLAAEPGIDFCGLLTHGGHSYAARDAAAIAAVGAQERDATRAFAHRLRDAGIDVPEISVGSTPTMSRASDLDGITEARPGNYVFFDAYQLAIGSCALADVAFSVLATVIGAYPERSELIVNAGALALSTAAGPTHVDPDCGFGLVCPAEDPRPLAGWRIFSLSQEHGQIRASEPGNLDRFPVGSRLRIIPNHSCTAASLFDRYHVVRGEQVLGEWRPARGW